MSAAPAEKGTWIKQNYDKLLLVLALFVLLASSVYLLLKIRVERNEIDEGSWQNPSRPKPALPIDLSAYASNSIALNNPYVGEPVTTNLLMVSELRVTCVNLECMKPIAFRALVCPFCTEAQPPHDDFDLDKDNMDDRWEREKGLNPRDPNDGTLDPDQDNFSNMEEFASGTDPFDPTDTPPPGAKLRLGKSQLRPFDLLFIDVTGEAGSERFKLKTRKGDRSFIRTLTEDVIGNVLTSYEPEGAEGKTLVLTKPDGTEIALTMGKVVESKDWEALLVSLLNNQQYVVQKESSVRVGGFDYKVVDITQRKVVIEDENSGETIDVVRISAAEIELLRRQPGVRGGGGRRVPR